MPEAEHGPVPVNEFAVQIPTQRSKPSAVLDNQVQSFPRLLILASRRQHTVQAQIHCSFGVVVRPGTGQSQTDPSA